MTNVEIPMMKVGKHSPGLFENEYPCYNLECCDDNDV